MKDWIQCRDYSNGGPTFVSSGSMAGDAPKAAAQDQFLKVLSVYTEKGNAMAALKCEVGKGVAVLVGTHPELESKWLASQPDAVAIEEELKSVGERHDEDVRKHVRKQLEKCSKERQRYFVMLMTEAGLGKYIQ
jgi:biotin--protein ligase